jgi:hypothetical protein
MQHGLRQLSPGFGLALETCPREPCWDVFHFRDTLLVSKAVLRVGRRTKREEVNEKGAGLGGNGDRFHCFICQFDVMVA